MPGYADRPSSVFFARNDPIKYRDIWSVDIPHFQFIDSMRLDALTSCVDAFDFEKPKETNDVIGSGLHDDQNPYSADDEDHFFVKTSLVPLYQSSISMVSRMVLKI